MNNITKIRIYTSTPNILNINLNIINCVKMAYTCDYCKRSNIVNLSRNYGYCAVVDRMLDVSSGNLMGLCDSSLHSNQSIGTRPTPPPRENSDVEQSVPTDDLRRKRKINIESVASSRSPSPTLSSNNCILPQIHHVMILLAILTITIHPIHHVMTLVRMKRIISFQNFQSIHHSLMIISIHI